VSGSTTAATSSSSCSSSSPEGSADADADAHDARELVRRIRPSMPVKKGDDRLVVVARVNPKTNRPRRIARRQINVMEHGGTKILINTYGTWYVRIFFTRECSIIQNGNRMPARAWNARTALEGDCSTYLAEWNLGDLDDTSSMWETYWLLSIQAAREAGRLEGLRIRAEEAS
jgi:hypothetical protein